MARWDELPNAVIEYILSLRTQMIQTLRAQTISRWRSWERSESLIWVGNINANQRVTFEIDCDNGWENTDSTMKGCYTIENVD